MRKALFSGLTVALVFFVGGCGDSYDSLAKDMVKLINEQAEVYEGIKSKEDAEKAKPKLDEIAQKMKAHGERFQKLAKDKDPLKALSQFVKAMEKQKDAAQKASKRLAEARSNAMKVEGASGVLTGINFGGGGSFPGLDLGAGAGAGQSDTANKPSSPLKRPQSREPSAQQPEAPPPQAPTKPSDAPKKP
jgi:hypothetical protein